MPDFSPQILRKSNQIGAPSKSSEDRHLGFVNRNKLFRKSKTSCENQNQQAHLSKLSKLKSEKKAVCIKVSVKISWFVCTLISKYTVFRTEIVWVSSNYINFKFKMLKFASKTLTKPV